MKESPSYRRILDLTLKGVIEDDRVRCAWCKHLYQRQEKGGHRWTCRVINITCDPEAKGLLHRCHKVDLHDIVSYRLKQRESCWRREHG